jgi:hypothetical protein
MKKAIGSAIAMTILLAGCDNKTDANEKNFGSAITRYLDQEGELCLNNIKWPTDVYGSDASLQNEMAALEAVGLAKAGDAEVDELNFLGQNPDGRKIKVRRYTLTDAAASFERTKEVPVPGPGGRKEMWTGLCWGKLALGKVVKWRGPMKMGDYQVAGVTYQYKIDGLADWAKRTEILAAFPGIGRVTEGAGKEEREQDVELTSVGWEPMRHRF